MRRIVIALVVLALAIGAWAFMRARREQRERIERQEAALLQFDGRAVDAIVITTGGVDHRFERLDDGWWIVQPMRDRADVGILEELMRATRRSRVSLRIDEPEPLASYGLEPANVVVHYEGVEVPDLHLGAVSPDQQGVYGRKTDSTEVLLIETVPGSLLTQIDVERFRDPSVVGVGRPSITEIAIASAAGAAMRVAREEDGWWVREPTSLPASDAAVASVLSMLESAEIARFVDEADRSNPAFGVGAGAIVVGLASSEGDRELRIGSATGIGDERYVARDDRPPVLAVRGIDAERIPASVAAVGETRLTKVNRYRVRSFTYRNGTDESSFARDDDGWRAGGAAAAEEDVFALLVATLQAAVEEWRLDPAPSSVPDAELSWELDDGTTGRVGFWGRRAAWDAVDGAIALVREAPPDLP